MQLLVLTRHKDAEHIPGLLIELYEVMFLSQPKGSSSQTGLDICIPAMQESQKWLPRRRETGSFLQRTQSPE